MVPYRTSRGNRLGLALVGSVLLGAGAFTLAQSQNLLGAHTAGTPLLTGSERRYAAEHGWLWIALAAAAVIVTLLCLRWLLVQSRRSKVDTFDLEPDAVRGATRVGAVVVTDAVADEVADYPGVRGAHAVLAGEASDPHCS